MMTPILDCLAKVSQKFEELHRQTYTVIPKEIVMTLEESDYFRLVHEMNSAPWSGYIGSDTQLVYCSPYIVITIKKEVHKCDCEYCTRSKHET